MSSTAESLARTEHREQATTGLGRGGVAPPLETRWKPGQSGNPHGYTKQRRFEDALNRGIKDADLARIVCTLIEMAAAGSPQHISMLVDRLDGKLDSRVEIDAKVDGAATLRELVKQIAAARAQR